MSIFTDQWLIGPTNQLQINLGKYFGPERRINVEPKCYNFKVKQENQWGSSGEAISADPWTTWLVLNSAQNLFVILQFLKQMLQLFEGECVPDIEKLKLELLKEEVGCVE